MISSAGVVIDVGAHMGFFSLLAARLVGSSGQVHALEPVPSTFATLTRNLSGHPNATTFNLAAWSESAEITINDFGPSHSAFNSVRRPRLTTVGAPAAPRRIRTPAVSLDDFAQEHRLRPSFIKIDAESAEGEILAGMSHLIENVRPVLCVEVGDLGVEGAAPSAKLVSMLASVGYTAFDYAEGAFRPHRQKQTYSYGNLLFYADADGRQAS